MKLTRWLGFHRNQDTETAVHPTPAAPPPGPAGRAASTPSVASAAPAPLAAAAPVLPSGARPWEAQEVVDAPRAQALIAAQFPELAPVRAEPLGVGWDNTAYLVNGAHVFRFPRREIAVGLLGAEAALLPAIAGRLPLAVPVPRFVGRPGPDFRWPFLGYAFVPGRTACAFRLGPEQRARCAEPLGRFLAALHGLPVEEAAALGATPDTIGRLDLGTRIPKARAMLTALGQALPAEQASAAAGLIDASAHVRAPARTALVHGDLYARHLLLDEQAQPTGVIDWGDIHLGHPAIDLAVGYGFLPASARTTFLRAYGRRVDAQTWWLARFRALFSALAIVSYGRDVGDADLEHEGRQALAHILTPG